MIIQAYAKINLAINVLNKKEDGYHEIDMVAIPLEMHDSLEIFEVPNNNQSYITSDDPNLVCDESNLAFKALALFSKHYEMKRSYRIHIYKRIPTEAGLGGGSADAAAIIRVLCKLQKIDPLSPEIIKLARQLGSDVPLCLYNKPCHVQGTGEILSDIELAKSFYVLVVKPNKGLSTKAVFQELDRIREENNQPIEQTTLLPLIDELQTSKPLEIDHIFNSLLQPAINLCPEINEVLNELSTNKFKYYGMSGSGSACYALHEDKKYLEEVAKKLRNKDYDVFVTSFLNHKQFLKKHKIK